MNILKVVQALQTAQSQIAAERDMCDEDEQELWDLYQDAIDEVNTYSKSQIP